MRTRLRVLPIMLFAIVLLAGACRAGDQGVTDAGDVQTGVGVDGKTIKLGELSPLTGPVAVIGKPLTRGHEVYFQYVNEVLGGVGQNLPDADKFKIELVTLDTQYSPDVHVQQYNAMKDQVLMIAQSLGTPTTKAILPQVNEDGILTGAATLASAWLKEKYVVPAGAPYPVQFINAAQYLKDQGITPKAGIIYQDDDYGAEGLQGLEFAAEKFGFEIVARATYKPTDQEFGAQVTAMRAAGADHVFLTTVPSATGRIAGTAATLQYAPRFIGQSPSWIGALAKNEQLAPYLAQTMWVVTDAACDWGETGEGCEGMAEMLQNLEKFAPDQEPDYYFVFGYTQARIVHQILERAVEQGDLTREGLVEAFESLQNVDLGGLLNPISYGPDCEDRIPVTASGINAVDPGSPIGIKSIADVDSAVIDEFPFC